MSNTVYYFICLVAVVGVVVVSLFTTKTINNDLSINRVKLIFDMPSIPEAIITHQRDARYLPYRLRLVVFNSSIYIFQVFRNVFNFWSIKNINDLLMLGNLYPIVVGFRYLYFNKKRWGLFILPIMGVSLVVGINKMVDARSAAFILLPTFGYLYFMGINKINLKVYLFLLTVSVGLYF